MMGEVDGSIGEGLFGFIFLEWVGKLEISFGLGMFLDFLWRFDFANYFRILVKLTVILSPLRNL
jgi:hypothetical protein